MSPAFEVRHAAGNLAAPYALSAAELIAAYRRQALSPADVADVHFERIRALDPELHAFTSIDADGARKAAVAATKRYARGSPLGPLDGVPIAVKDLFEIAGQPCGAGSMTRRGHVAHRTAASVARLLDAGAVVLGKTHTVEFALGGWGTNALLGTPRNPWFADGKFTPGGSSSGSAVAVAAGLATLALGTDTGGSIRIPAAFNGLVGLKTTPGLVSLDGVVPLSPSLDTVGPIARTVDDAAMLFGQLITHDRGAATATKPHPDLRDMTLGIMTPGELRDTDAEIAAAFERSLKQLESLGARLRDVRMPVSAESFAGNHVAIMMNEAYQLYGALAEDPRSDLDPAVRARILSGMISAEQAARARARARAAKAKVFTALDGCDALLTPTAKTLPIPVVEVDEATTPSILTRFVNQIGFCALAVPNGLSLIGAPMSLQIVCRPFEEHVALRIGRACSMANRPWNGF